MKRISIASVILLLCGFTSFAQQAEQNHAERFEQLGTSLRSPNVYRTASGAPGHMYWQQKADHEIVVELNDENQSIKGWQKITYHNYSPDPLSYLWIQLDQNQRAKDSNTPKVTESRISPNMSLSQLGGILWHDQDLGYKILSVKDLSGRDIPVTVNKT
ncbi:MAG: M1 family peptidase, partial [Daejeonella sp.]|nr:M1 family peptidase [Daejeonella sp.]